MESITSAEVLEELKRILNQRVTSPAEANVFSFEEAQAYLAMSAARTRKALDSLIDDGVIETCWVKVEDRFGRFVARPRYRLIQQ